METPALGDRDAFGVKHRTRRMPSSRSSRCGTAAWWTGSSSSPKADERPSLEADVLMAALQQFYAEHDAPPEVHVPVSGSDEDRGTLESWLSERAGRRVRVMVPRRGEKRGLLDLAVRNAAMAYESHFSDGAVSAFGALDTLRGALGLAALPRRIECFDISTLQGRETVGAMVVCVEGRMRRSEYRKFRIRGAESPDPGRPIQDDFAAMYEVVLRRYRRLLEHGGPFPDLIVIDGGKGQLGGGVRGASPISASIGSWPSAWRSRRNCCSRASATRVWRSRTTARRSACSSASATRRIGSR